MAKISGEEELAVVAYNIDKQEPIGYFKDCRTLSRYLYPFDLRAGNGRVTSALRRNGKICNSIIDCRIKVRYCTYIQKIALAGNAFKVFNGYPTPQKDLEANFHSTRIGMAKEIEFSMARVKKKSELKNKKQRDLYHIKKKKIKKTRLKIFGSPFQGKGTVYLYCDDKMVAYRSYEGSATRKKICAYWNTVYVHPLWKKHIFFTSIVKNNEI